MLANKRFVKDTMYGMVPAHFKAPGMDRLYWCDKAKDPARRNLAFKFSDPAKAAAAAEVLRGVLTQHGYTNKVRVTHTDSDPIYRRWGGDYVRVQVLMD
jgi:hypothetical protein